MEKSDQDGLYDVPVEAGDYTVQVTDHKVEVVSDTDAEKAVSSLDLLAFTYGNSSDTDEEHVEPGISLSSDEDDLSDCSLPSNQNEHSRSANGVSSKSNFLSDDSKSSLFEPYHCDGAALSFSHPLSRLGYGYESSVQISGSIRASERTHEFPSANCKGRSQEILDSTFENGMRNLVSMESNSLDSKYRDPLISGRVVTQLAEVPETDVKMESIESGHADSSTISLLQRSDDNSSRMHIFCLEHALEVEKQFRPIGGVHMLLLCHPDYPKIEVEAKSLAEELGINYFWNDIPFREATREDWDRIQSALDEDEVVPGNGDWTVKLGINLYYSANLSRSPLYSKQMPYNSVIYKAFGRSSPADSPAKPKISRKGHNKQKKIVVAGKWCGKVWMSNQVHPYLAQTDTQEQEEHSRNFHTRTTPVENLERKLELSSQTEQLLFVENSLGVAATSRSKPGRKRKQAFETLVVKKPKYSQTEKSINVIDDSLEDNTPLQSGRILRSGQAKHGTQKLHNAREKNVERYVLFDKEEIEGGPSTRLRKRLSKPTDKINVKSMGEKQIRKRKAKKVPASNKDARTKDEEVEYQCDIDGCTMGFSSKQDLVLHKRNICPVKGCGKKFFSHKYLVQHRKVHMDDRPLKCPWKGCKMTFKWAWARTEHIRVHTGARPYVCHEPGCGQTFRFVSDFSRHKRKTGHSVKGKG